MNRILLSTGSPLEKEAGYSRAVILDNWAFVAGTTGYDYVTMKMPPDIRTQTRNCLETIRQTLGQGGFQLSDVVRATYYVTDKTNVQAVFEEVGKTFANIRPAATMILCDLVKDDMLIEIEVTAMKG